MNCAGALRPREAFGSLRSFSLRPTGVSSVVMDKALKAALMRALHTGPSKTDHHIVGNIGSVAWFQPSMAANVKELIEQLRNPGRVYPLPDDDQAAKKAASLLEAAVAGKAPVSTIDILTGTAARLLDRFQLLN